MKGAPLMLVLLVACAVSAVAPPEPKQERKRDPKPDNDNERHCRGYCDTVSRCEPEHEFGDCPSDCARLLADPELSAVSGFTAAHVRCWSEATTCELAIACDDVAEGDRK